MDQPTTTTDHGELFGPEDLRVVHSGICALYDGGHWKASSLDVVQYAALEMGADLEGDDLESIVDAYWHHDCQSWEPIELTRWLMSQLVEYV